MWRSMPLEAAEALLQNEIVRLCEVESDQFLRELLLECPGVRDRLYGVASLPEIVRICIHGGAVEDEFLFMECYGIMFVVTEK